MDTILKKSFRALLLLLAFILLVSFVPAEASDINRDEGQTLTFTGRIVDGDDKLEDIKSPRLLIVLASGEVKQDPIELNDGTFSFELSDYGNEGNDTVTLLYESGSGEIKNIPLLNIYENSFNDFTKAGGPSISTDSLTDGRYDLGDIRLSRASSDNNEDTNPPAETVITNLAAKASFIQGETNPGATVTLVREDGEELKTRAGDDGKFAINLDDPFKDGETLTVRAELNGSTDSKTFTVSFKNKEEDPAPPAEEPEAPAEEPTPPAEEPKAPTDEPTPPAEEPETPTEEPAPQVNTPASTSKRIAGSNKFATAIEISKKTFPNGSDAVIIASGDNTADALAAGPLAIEENGPILLVSSSLTPEVSAEITRLNPDKIFIVGGEKSVSPAIASALPVNPTRLYGANRFNTSVEIAKYLNINYGYNRALLANGYSTVDALASSAYAARYKKAIVLSPASELPQAVKTYFYNGADDSVDIIGGGNSINQSIENTLGEMFNIRVFGLNRYDTAVQLATYTYTDSLPPKGAVIVSGDNYKLVDALAAAPFAYKNQMPLLLTNGSTLDNFTQEYIDDNNINNFYVIGGTGTVSEALFNTLTSSSPAPSQPEDQPDQPQPQEPGEEKKVEPTIIESSAVSKANLMVLDIDKLLEAKTYSEILGIIGENPVATFTPERAGRDGYRWINTTDGKANSPVTAFVDIEIDDDGNILNRKVDLEVQVN